MKKYVWIGCGGFLGAVLRYLIKGIQIYGYHEAVPLNTLFINVSGTFALALIMTLALEIFELDADIRLGVTTGFLGAYTTFSTLCKEVVGLMRNGAYFSAISYLTVSAVLGLGAAYFGTVLAREIGLRIGNRNQEQEEPGPIIGKEGDAE